MVFKAITEALTSVKDTVRDIREETQAAAKATEAVATATTALDKSVVRVLNTAQEEASKMLGALKGLGVETEEKSAAPLLSAQQLAAQNKSQRVAMYADQPTGPAAGRGPDDWRARFAKPSYQQEAETAPTSSPSP